MALKIGGVTVIDDSKNFIVGGTISLNNSTGTAGQVLTSVGTSTPTWSDSAIGRLKPTTIKTSNYTADINDLVRVDSTLNPFNITLPINPTDGDQIGIIDISNTFGVNNITVLSNGKSVEFNPTSLLLNITGSYISLLYSSSNQNWKLEQSTSNNGLPSQTGNANKLLTTDGSTPAWIPPVVYNIASVTYTLPTVVVSLPFTFTMVGVSSLINGTISSFNITDWNGNVTSVSATDNTATKTFTAPATLGQALSISVVAVDNFGNYSQPVGHTTNTTTHAAPTGTIIVTAPSEVIQLTSGYNISFTGGVATNGATFTYSITNGTPAFTFSKTSNITSGEIITFSAPASAIVQDITFTVNMVDSLGSTSTGQVVSIHEIITPQVTTPTNISPTNATSGLGQTPTLTGNAFQDTKGYIMSASQWQVSTSINFITTLISTGDITGTSISYIIPTATLVVSTPYYWRVRYKDSNGVYSSWSNPTSFTTAASFGPTTIGQSYGGGYYAGKITDAGVGYYIIVAPKASGEITSVMWKTTNDAGPTGVQTLTNGPAATLAMFNAGSTLYPAATYCHNLSIGGFSDWYLPARDELEVVYRAFKPTTTTNNIGIKAAGGYGSDGTGYGANANSIPSGAAYTAVSPTQTAVSLYITVSGTEAFTATTYWSSTEFTATDAWNQNFRLGNQSYINKTIAIYVRAVRRLVI